MPAGTITLTNDSNIVDGSGTSFTSEFASGDVLASTVGEVTYTLFIKSVDSDTQVTLVKNYDGPTATGLAWSAIPRNVAIAIPAQIATEVSKALRGLNQDKSNWQQVFSSSGTITVTLPDGSSFSGPSWPKIVEIVETADIERLEQLAEQINTDTAQVAADKEETANSAADAKQSAVDSAQYAAAAQQYATQAGESVTEAGKQVTLANEATNRAQEQAAVSQSSAETATTEADRARTEADRAEEAADRAETGLPDADVIWEVLGIDPDNVTYMQEGYINPTVYNTGFGVGSTMLAARVNGRGPANYSAVYPGLYLRPASILAPYQSAGESPAVVQLQTNAPAAAGVPGSWRQLGYGSLSENAASPIEGKSYPVTLWIRIF